MPYDEQWNIERVGPTFYGLYQQAGRVWGDDPSAIVWPMRTQYDIDCGMEREAALSKHAAECSAALGLELPPPEPTPPPAGMPARLYRTSSWPQALCLHGTATPVVLRSTTAFALAEQVAHGREAEAVRFLDWCAASDVTCVRVLCMCKNMFALTPEEGYQALPRVLQLAGERGLYVEVVALADVYDEDGVPIYPGHDWGAHVETIALICVDYPNSLLELVNEPMQKWQKFSPEELRAYAQQIPAEVPYCLGAPDDGHDESTVYCDPEASYQTIHTDRSRAPWGNVRHIRECQVMSEDINQHTWNDEPGKEFTLAQQFAIGALCRVCMVADTFHSNTVRYAEIPTGEELAWMQARCDGWAFVPDSDWGTFANYGWQAPNPEPPIQSCHFWDADGRAYSLVVGSDKAYTVLLNACRPVWKAGWSCVRQDERTSRSDGQIETGIYELRR